VTVIVKPSPVVTNAPARQLDRALRFADLAANGVLVVDMGGMEPFETGDLVIEPRLLHQALIA